MGSTEYKKGGSTRERKHKRTGLFSKGVDFYIDSGTSTIRDNGEYLDKADTCIISDFIKRSQPNHFRKGSKVSVKTAHFLPG